jgi:osmotically-inducible protein OsmY
MFPFFRRKRSKWEIARDTVLDYVHEAIEHVPVDKIEDLKDHLIAKPSTKVKVATGAAHALKSAGGVLHSAASTASGVKEHLVEAAAGAATTGAKVGAVGVKKAHDAKASVADLVAEKGAVVGELVHKAQEKLSHAHDHAADTASEAREAAQEKAEQAAKKSQAVAASAQESAGDAQQNFLASLSTIAGLFAERKQQTEDIAEDKAAQAREAWEDRQNQLEAAAKEKARLAKKAAKAKKAELAKIQDEAEERASQIEVRKRKVKVCPPDVEVKKRKVEVREPEVVVDESSSKFLWFAVGLLAGTILAILFSPTTGRRNLATVKDKLGDVSREAANLAQAAKERVAGAGEDDADDVTVADRVRTALGDSHTTRDLPHLNIDSVDGVVTLRGPVLEEAQIAAVEAVVRGVKGVKEVVNDIIVENPSENDATFVG